MAYNIATENKAYDWIAYDHDGPVTQFVLISRAIEAAEAKRFPVEELANALHIALIDYAP